MKRTATSSRSQGTASNNSSQKNQRSTPSLETDSAIIDRYRSIVFPNNVRHTRKQSGMAKLLSLSRLIPEIPYIRLSKIERGEIFAKPAELLAIASAMRVQPRQLLIDITDPAFDIAVWSAELNDPEAFDAAEDRFAVLLAAALRARRETDATLSIASMESDYGIPPVILSRLENAYKTLDRWNDTTLQSLCRVFGVANVAALRAHILATCANGALNDHVDLVAHPRLRITKTRTKVAALRDALTGKTASAARNRTAGKAQPPRRVDAASSLNNIAASAPSSPVLAAIQAADSATVRLVPVFGAPLGDGLIARTPTGETIEAPRIAGPNAYGLRVCRPTLGPGLPGRATVIVDPDRFPSSGGLAAVREAAGLRLLMITFARDGRMIGYSEHPNREVTIDDLDPADVATVIGAIFE